MPARLIEQVAPAAGAEAEARRDELTGARARPRVLSPRPRRLSGDVGWLLAALVAVAVVCEAPYLVAEHLGPPALDRLGTFWFARDFSQYQAAMREGARQPGWLIHDHFTAEPHAPALIYPLYAGAGKLAATLGADPLRIFGSLEWLGRVAVVLALYAFARAFLVGRRARCLALLLALGTLGLDAPAAPLRLTLDAAGLGWAGGWLPETINPYLEISSFGVLLSAPHLMLGLALTLLAAPLYLRAIGALPLGPITPSSAPRDGVPASPARSCLRVATRDAAPDARTPHPISGAARDAQMCNATTSTASGLYARRASSDRATIANETDRSPRAWRGRRVWSISPRAGPRLLALRPVPRVLWLALLGADVLMLSLVHAFNVPVLVSVLGLHALLSGRRAWPAALVAAAAAAPMTLYSLVLFNTDPFWSGTYGAQNLMPAPPPWALPVDFGVVLLMAPLAWPVVRTWPTERRRLLLAWVGLGLVWLYAPVPYQRRFAFGVQPGLAVLAATGMLHANSLLRACRVWRRVLNYALVGGGAATWLLVYVSLIASAARNTPAEVYLWSKPEAAAAAWLGAHSTPDDLVLASTPFANPLAGAIDGRVVHGHVVATLHSSAKEALVGRFYAAGTSATERERLLHASGATVVALGPRERALAAGGSDDLARQVAPASAVQGAAGALGRDEPGASPAPARAEQTVDVSRDSALNWALGSGVEGSLGSGVSASACGLPSCPSESRESDVDALLDSGVSASYGQGESASDASLGAAAPPARELANAGDPRVDAAALGAPTGSAGAEELASQFSSQLGLRLVYDRDGVELWRVPPPDPPAPSTASELPGPTRTPPWPASASPSPASASLLFVSASHSPGSVSLALAGASRLPAGGLPSSRSPGRCARRGSRRWRWRPR